MPLCVESVRMSLVRKGVKMTLIEDSNNKPGKHELKNKWWADKGIEVQRYRLPVGDYILMNEKVADVLERKAKRGIPVKMMDFLGTYDVCCDSKYGIMEICSNLTNSAEHQRVKDELILAQNNNIKLYFVVENEFQWISQSKNIYNEPITCVKDLFRWKNPRAFIFRRGVQAYPRATKGAQLAKICMTLETRYGCKFVFCKPDESAETIIKILEGRYEL